MGDWAGTKSGCEGCRLTGGGQFGGLPGELVGVRAGLGHRLQGLQAREVGRARQEQLTVGEAEQGGRVRRVTGLLGGPEGTCLGELPLPLLGERLGHGGAYPVGVTGGARLRYETVRSYGESLGGQFGVQGRDLPTQPQQGAQNGDAHGRGDGGCGEQQSKRRSAH